MPASRLGSPPIVEGDPLCAEIEARALYRLQWFRNARGGQRFGNRDIIVRANEDDYQQLIRGLLRPDAAANPGIRAYEAQFGVTYLRLISREGTGPWELIASGDGGDLAHWLEANEWAIRVESFDSAEAVAHGLTSDTEGANWRARSAAEQGELLERAGAMYGYNLNFDRALVSAMVELTGRDPHQLAALVKAVAECAREDEASGPGPG